LYTYSPWGRVERGRPKKRWKDHFKVTCVGVATRQCLILEIDDDDDDLKEVV
jgi:hypothetical protein